MTNGNEDPGGADPATEVGSTAVTVRDLFLDWLTAHFRTVEVFGTDQKTRWCPEWWRHPEAVARLVAVWMAHEDARADPAGLSSWWLHQWDPTCAFLFAEKGPFRHCDPERGHNWSSRSGDRRPAEPTLPPNGWRLPSS